MIETSALRDDVVYMADIVDRAWTDGEFKEDDILRICLEDLRTAIQKYNKAAKEAPVITMTELRNRFPAGTEFTLMNDLESKSSSHAWALEITPNLDRMKDKWPWPTALVVYGSSEEKCLQAAHKKLLEKKL